MDRGYVSPRQKRLSELFGLGRWGVGDELESGHEDEGQESVDLDECENFDSHIEVGNAGLIPEEGVVHYDCMNIIQVLDITGGDGDLDAQVSCRANPAKRSRNMTEENPHDDYRASHTSMVAGVSTQLQRCPYISNNGILNNEVDYPDLMLDSCYGAITTDEDTGSPPSSEFECKQARSSPPIMQRNHPAAPANSPIGSNAPEDARPADHPSYHPESQVIHKGLELPTGDDLLLRSCSKRQKISHCSANHNSLLSQLEMPGRS